MTAIDSKSYLEYVSRSIQTIILIIILLIRNFLMLTFLRWLKKLRRILMLLNLKLMIESQLISIRIFLVKVTLKIGLEKYFLLILIWKIILRLIQLKI